MNGPDANRRGPADRSRVCVASSRQLALRLNRAAASLIGHGWDWAGVVTYRYRSVSLHGVARKPRSEFAGVMGARLALQHCVVARPVPIFFLVVSRSHFIAHSGSQTPCGWLI